jgi:hypothetical protein
MIKTQGEFPKIRWEVKDYANNIVVLKEDTCESHIQSDHTDADAEYRMSIEEQAKNTIKNPRYVLVDKIHQDRQQYVDLILIPNEEEIKIRAIAVTIDKSCNPYEVITWTEKNKLKRNIPEGGVIYDASDDI